MRVAELAELVSGHCQLPALKEPLLRFIQNCGFETYCFMGVQGYRIQTETGVPAHCTTIPKDWERTYVDNRFLSDDPGLHLALRRSRPITQADFVLRDLPPSRRRVMEACIDHGMQHFVCVPTRGAGGTVSTLFAYTRAGQAAYDEALQGGLESLIAGAAYLHESLEGERLVPPLDVDLTARERECMLWLAHGNTAWEIAKIIGISERTVRFHIQNVMAKLDSHTRVQAVARAVALGLIVP